MRKLAAIFFVLLSIQLAASANDDFTAGCRALENKDYFTGIARLQKSIEDPKFPLPEYAAFLTAKSYFNLSQPEVAESFSQQVIKNGNPVLLPEAYLLIGKCRLARNSGKGAEDVFLYLIKKYPATRLEAEAHYLLASAAEMQDKNKRAYELYYHIDTYFPLSGFAAESRKNMRRLEKKIGFRRPRTSAKALYEKGKAYWENYSYKTAAALFTKLMKEHPKSKYVKSALYMTGLAEYETSDYVSAINSLERNIKARGPQRENSYYYLGRSYGRRGKYDLAIDALQYFISLYPKNPLADNAYYYIGYYNEIEDNFNSAILAYDNLTKKYPASPLIDAAFWQIGRIYYRNGNLDYARDYFSQAFNSPAGTDTPKCLFWWAKLTEAKDRSESAAIYSYLIKRFDYSYYAYRAHERLATLHYQSPLDQRAIKRSSIKLKEDLPLKSRLLLEAGLVEYAEYEAGQIKPGNNFHTRLGLTLHKSGEYRAPIGFAEKKIAGAILKGEAGLLPKETWQLSYPKGFWEYVKDEAGAYGIDPYLVLALIREESRFNPKALSRSYARGLMQIISGTAKLISRELGIAYNKERLYSPKTNIKMGTFYLSSLLERFGGNFALALAGYNGGPVRVKKWVNEWYNGDTQNFDPDDFVINIPIRETREYVEKVLGSYYQYKRIYD